jgi:hypothetical protein
MDTGIANVRVAISAVEHFMMVNGIAPVAPTALDLTNDPEPLPKYEPSSPKAVVEVKGLLLKKLPLKLVDAAIEYAEYWPCTTVTTGGRTTTAASYGPPSDMFIVSLRMWNFSSSHNLADA